MPPTGPAYADPSSSGAILPLLAALSATTVRIPLIVVVALIALVGLGALGAFAGGAPWKRASLRVVTWSSLAMALTYVIGLFVGAHT